MSNATVKLTFSLHQDVAQAMKDISTKRGTSMTEVLRQAISNEKYFQDASERNEKILVEDKSGKLRRVVMQGEISLRRS